MEHVIGLDMGGTSTDVFLAEASSGGVKLTSESTVAGVPLSVPMLDIHTVGAGGGSIARFDSGGMLRVGPESAGSDPGPACFGRGSLPTVTDANLVLGRLDPDRFLGGAVRLDLSRTLAAMDSAKGSLGTVEEFAGGILRVVEAQMERAIRVISVERGHDPKQFTLVPFGGGGPLHACSLAAALGISAVLVPAMPGALSALGILVADTARDFSRTVMLPADALADVEENFHELDRNAMADFAGESPEGIGQRTVDIRYQGQGYELNVPWGPGAIDAFHRLHQQRYGFSDPQRAAEIVNLRLRIVAPAEPFELPRRKPVPGDGRHAFLRRKPVVFEGVPMDTAVYERGLLQPGDQIAGAAVVTEYSSATLVPPGCNLEVDPWGNLVIHIGNRR
jgi:N-methylhydantoinase A